MSFDDDGIDPVGRGAAELAQRDADFLSIHSSHRGSRRGVLLLLASETGGGRPAGDFHASNDFGL